MKKVLLLILAVIFIFVFAACSPQPVLAEIKVSGAEIGTHIDDVSIDLLLNGNEADARVEWKVKDGSSMKAVDGDKLLAPGRYYEVCVYYTADATEENLTAEVSGAELLYTQGVSTDGGNEFVTAFAVDLTSYPVVQINLTGAEVGSAISDISAEVLVNGEKTEVRTVWGYVDGNEDVIMADDDVLMAGCGYGLVLYYSLPEGANTEDLYIEFANEYAEHMYYEEVENEKDGIVEIMSSIVVDFTQVPHFEITVEGVKVGEDIDEALVTAVYEGAEVVARTEWTVFEDDEAVPANGYFDGGRCYQLGVYTDCPEGVLGSVCISENGELISARGVMAEDGSKEFETLIVFDLTNEAPVEKEETPKEDEAPAPSAHEHNWVIDSEKSYDMDCGWEKEGYIYKTCECGAVEEYVVPVEHDFFVDSKEKATCEEDGTIVYICNLCKQVEYESIPALGHDIGEDGICKRCGK